MSTSEATIVVNPRLRPPGGAALVLILHPRIVIQGEQYHGTWQRPSEFPVPPGTHRVQIRMPYPWRRTGTDAETTVEIGQGETVELEYMAPMWPFLRGALGPPSQPQRGLWPTVGVVVVAFGLVCATFL